MENIINILNARIENKLNAKLSTIEAERQEIQNRLALLAQKELEAQSESEAMKIRLEDISEYDVAIAEEENNIAEAKKMAFAALEADDDNAVMEAMNKKKAAIEELETLSKEKEDLIAEITAEIDGEPTQKTEPKPEVIVDNSTISKPKMIKVEPTQEELEAEMEMEDVICFVCDKPHTETPEWKLKLAQFC